MRRDVQMLNIYRYKSPSKISQSIIICEAFSQGRTLHLSAYGPTPLQAFGVSFSWQTNISESFHINCKYRTEPAKKKALEVKKRPSSHCRCILSHVRLVFIMIMFQTFYGLAIRRLFQIRSNATVMSLQESSSYFQIAYPKRINFV